MSEILGVDISDWQGIVNAKKMAEAKVKVAGVKLTQGIAHIQKRAKENNNNLRAVGIKVFPYHFFTTDAPTAQYDWFMKCLDALDCTWDLPAAADYEAYNQVTMEPYTAMREGSFAIPLEYYPQIAYFDISNPIEYASDLDYAYNAYIQSLGLVIPSSAYLYTFLTKLKGWNGFDVPSVYTNLSTANTKLINSSIYNWKQFRLWHAQWNVETPTIPTAWKGEKIWYWQYKVLKGAQEFGVDGDLDLDRWMDRDPFPGDVPPAQESYIWTGHRSDGKVFTGEVKERC